MQSPKRSIHILRRIRKDLGFKQHEVAGQDMTRNLVSLIENNRATLNRNNAQSLVRNINALCVQKGIDLHLEFKDLFVPGSYEAKTKARHYIEFLKDAIAKRAPIEEDKISEISVFLSNWDLLYQNSYLYQLIGQYYESVKEYQKSFFYYVRAFENAVKTTESQNILRELAPKAICSAGRLGRYTEALDLSNACLAHLPLTDKEARLSISAYKAQILFSLGRLDQALDVAGQLLWFCASGSLEYVKTSLLKISIWLERQDFEQARLALENLEQKKLAEESFRLWIQAHKIRWAVKSQDFHLLEEYLGQVERLERSVDPQFEALHWIYLDIAGGYYSAQKITKASAYMLKALQKSLEQEDYEAGSQIIEVLQKHPESALENLYPLYEQASQVQNPRGCEKFLHSLAVYCLQTLPATGPCKEV